MPPDDTAEMLELSTVTTPDPPVSPGSTSLVRSQVNTSNRTRRRSLFAAPLSSSEIRAGRRRVQSAPANPVVSKPTPIPLDYVYWKSPASMVAAFIAGILMAVGHHLYYSSFNRDIVGSPSEQGTVLRIGNFFAFATQFALAGSVGFAYTQWLWKTLRTRTVSVTCLDSAFEADKAIMGLFSLEMWWKIKLGSCLALLVWLLQIPSLFTPATLTVVPGSNVTDTTMLVPRLDISTNSSAQYPRFAYSVPLLNNTVFGFNDTNKLFVAPRTVVARLTAATSTTGNILPLNAPSLNSSYSLAFFGPSVHCEDANATQIKIIDHIKNLRMSLPIDNYTELAMAYFGFVPNEFILNGGNVTDPEIAEDVSDVRMQKPVNGSNEIWSTFQRYGINSTGARVNETHYLVCRLWNSSYDVNFKFEFGNQTITKNEATKPIKLMPYPKDDLNTPTDFALHSYSAVMWALTDQLVGSMGWWVDNNAGRKFSEIAAPLEHNSLLGSVDLDPFFDYNNALYLPNPDKPPSGNLSDQRLEDKAMARNRTLHALIEELAFNTTIGFMSSHLLSPDYNTTVSQTNTVNRYSYNATTLFLSYGFAILATFIANILGTWAYISNGAAHDKTFSSVLGATREDNLGVLFCERTHGKLPVPKKTQRAFLKYKRMNDGGWSFRRTEEEGEEDRTWWMLLNGRRRRRRSSVTTAKVMEGRIGKWRKVKMVRFRPPKGLKGEVKKEQSVQPIAVPGEPALSSFRFQAAT